MPRKQPPPRLFCLSFWSFTDILRFPLHFFGLSPMTALVAPSYSGHQRLLVPHGATQTQSWRWTGNGCVFPEATRAPVASETAGNVGGEAGRSEARLLDCFGDRELTRQRRLGYWRSKDYQPYNLMEVQSVFFEHFCDLCSITLSKDIKSPLDFFLSNEHMG